MAWSRGGGVEAKLRSNELELWSPTDRSSSPSSALQAVGLRQALNLDFFICKTERQACLPHGFVLRIK